MCGWIFASDGRRVTLFLLLLGHFCCGYWVWFYHNPGYQSWVAVPVLGGLATIWLLAGSTD